MSEILDPVACVQRVIECDNGRDRDGYRSILHDDYVAYVHGAAAATNADDEADALARWWVAAPDVHLEPLEMFEERGVVTLRYRLTGTNTGEFFGRPATGKRFEVENCTLLQVESGKVKQVWRFSDTLGLMTQLGMIPAPGD